MNFPLIYRWKLNALFGPSGSPLFGRHCRIVARSNSLNTRLVEFDNGERHFVSGNALRKR